MLCGLARHVHCTSTSRLVQCWLSSLAARSCVHVAGRRNRHLPQLACPVLALTCVALLRCLPPVWSCLQSCPALRQHATARLVLPPPATSSPSLSLLRTSYSSTPSKPIQLLTSASLCLRASQQLRFRRSTLHHFSINSQAMAEIRRKLVIVGDGACGKTCLLM